VLRSVSPALAEQLALARRAEAHRHRLVDYGEQLGREAVQVDLVA
jgi:hypothetical protein